MFSIRGLSMSKDQENKRSELLEKIDPNRRDAIERILKTSAFAVPVIASFNLDGLTVSMAHAQTANGSGITAVSNSMP